MRYALHYNSTAMCNKLKSPLAVESSVIVAPGFTTKSAAMICTVWLPLPADATPLNDVIIETYPLHVIFILYGSFMAYSLILVTPLGIMNDCLHVLEADVPIPPTLITFNSPNFFRTESAPTI